jgi:hypothetical protein
MGADMKRSLIKLYDKLHLGKSANVVSQKNLC